MSVEYDFFVNIGTHLGHSVWVSFKHIRAITTGYKDMDGKGYETIILLEGDNSMIIVDQSVDEVMKALSDTQKELTNA